MDHKTAGKRSIDKKQKYPDEKYQVGITEKRKKTFSPFPLESYDISGADINITPNTEHFCNICDVISGRTRGDGFRLDPSKSEKRRTTTPLSM